MSPQFHCCHCSICLQVTSLQDTLLANILALSPPWLITVLVPSLPPSFSHLFCYFFIFSASRKKKVKKKKVLSLFSLFGNLTTLCHFLIFYQVCLCCTNSKLISHCVYLFISSYCWLSSYFIYAQILHLFTQSGTRFHYCYISSSCHSRYH